MNAARTAVTWWWGAGAVAIILACNTCFAAGVFKWTDKDGQVHYGDRPPESAAAKSVGVSAAAGGGASAERDVEIEETVLEYYEIQGATANDLHRAMKAYGPLWPGESQRSYAQCKWQLRWKYTFQTEGGQCRVGALKTTVSAIISFPKWSNPAAGSAALRDKWEQMTRALRRHEDGHKDNGIRAANDFARRVRALAPERDCQALDQKIKATGDRIISEYRNLDPAYDRATNHGANQGVNLF